MDAVLGFPDHDGPAALRSHAFPHRPRLHSRLGAETTNGDGFGLGWYGRWLWMHDVAPRRRLRPEDARLEAISDETRIIVSEPLADLPGAWNEVPEASDTVVEPGAAELRPFRPTPP